MSERTARVATPDGPMETLVVEGASAGAPGTADVLLLGDNAGVRETLRDLARDLAARGPRVALPDLYHRSGVRCRPPLDAADRARIHAARLELTLERAGEDLAALAEALAPRPLVLLGLCIGSGFALGAWRRLAGRVAGIVLVDPCELGDRAGSAAVPPRGARVPVEGILPAATWDAFEGPLRARLATAAAPVTLEVRPGLAHGFCFSDWPGAVHDAAERRRALDRVAALAARVGGDAGSV